MLRLVLIVLLVAATALARHAGRKIKRTEDTLDTCYGRNHPSDQCPTQSSEYPVWREIQRARDVVETKKILLSGDNLENLCDEAEQYLECFISALDSASDECKEEYKGQRLTLEQLDKAVSLRELVCDNETVKDIRNNLDCLIDANLFKHINTCSFPNIDMDCSQVESSEENTARRDCYDEKFRETCDFEAILECTADQVILSCGLDAGDLVVLIGNAYLERFYICRDGDSHIRSLLKFLRK
jgi:hypothetical protein